MKFLLITTLLLPVLAQAEIYKSVDAEGNTVYTDKQDPKAEEFIPPSMNAIQMPKLAPKEDPVEKPAAHSYKELSIVSPSDQQTLRTSSGPVSVQLQVRPELMEGDSISIIIDGSVVVKKTRQLAVTLPGIDRGTHQLSAIIKSSKGKTLKSSKPVTFFLKQHSSLY